MEVLELSPPQLARRIAMEPAAMARPRCFAGGEHDFLHLNNQWSCQYGQRKTVCFSEPFSCLAEQILGLQAGVRLFAVDRFCIKMCP